MNTKRILGNIVIFGIGVGTGYLICKKTLTEQYKIDLSDVKQFYYGKLDEMGVMDEDFEPEDLNDEEGDEDEQENIEDEDDEMDEQEIKDYYERVMKYSNTIRQGDEGKGRPLINYNKPPLDISEWGDIEEDPEDEDEDEMDLAYEAELEARAEEFAQRKYENRSNGRPYVIDYNEWKDGPEEYERQFLYYYSADRVLCEDDDSEVEDEEELIGFDYEDVLDMQTSVYVRNDSILTLYEIHRIDASYKDTVANALETPREREYRLLSRRKQALDE